MSYELIRCTGCHHEKVRRREGAWIMDCAFCGSREHDVFDLIPVDRDEDDRYLPTPQGLAYIEALKGAAHAA